MYISRLLEVNALNSDFLLKMAEIADRIAAVRKEAENLKELVKQKRDSLADTTRKFYL